METTTTQKLEVVGITITAGAVGALAAGPLGLGIGLAVGGLLDFLILRAKTAAPSLPPGAPSAVITMATIPGGAGLPPGADLDAANRAVTMMRIGKPSGVIPGRAWLSKFQTSVGLPATGQLDAQSRAMIVLAVPAAAGMPSVTILG
jgi:hypothetical protein